MLPLILLIFVARCTADENGVINFQEFVAGIAFINQSVDEEEVCFPLLAREQTVES
eukprot:m.279138 g.279138  ORF g.279138 m.279138 type:complete len:56 (+) comp11103_c3_seq9:1271-1438(+)